MRNVRSQSSTTAEYIHLVFVLHQLTNIQSYNVYMVSRQFQQTINYKISIFKAHIGLQWIQQ
jgi:hypothetical protein